MRREIRYIEENVDDSYKRVSERQSRIRKDFSKNNALFSLLNNQQISLIFLKGTHFFQDIYIFRHYYLR